MPFVPVYSHHRVPVMQQPHHVMPVQARAQILVPNVVAPDIWARRQLLRNAQELERFANRGGPYYPEFMPEYELVQHYHRLRVEQEAQMREDVECAIRAQNRARARRAAQELMLTSQQPPGSTFCQHSRVVQSSAVPVAHPNHPVFATAQSMPYGGPSRAAPNVVYAPQQPHLGIVGVAQAGNQHDMSAFNERERVANSPPPSLAQSEAQLRTNEGENVGHNPPMNQGLGARRRAAKGLPRLRVRIANHNAQDSV